MVTSSSLLPGSLQANLDLLEGVGDGGTWDGAGEGASRRFLGLIWWVRVGLLAAHTDTGGRILRAASTWNGTPCQGCLIFLTVRATWRGWYICVLSTNAGSTTLCGTCTLCGWNQDGFPKDQM